mmetsp:Transcript_13046/g.25597  ORF Transcript_13046/g.25597 Transcript_13046/m.25597 type:complete len:304 (-) Transcript_13046:249-1160(-)
MKAVRMTRLNDPTAFKGTQLELDAQEVVTPRGTLKTVRGCRCRRSKCQKKYCECFGAGVLCGANCVCEDCLNFDPQAGPYGDQTAPPPLSTKKESGGHLPTREEASAVAARSAALASRRPFISVQVEEPSSKPLGAEADSPPVDMEEDEQEEEGPPEWEDHGDLACETLLSARSTVSEPAEGTKGMPLQARHGWDGEEESAGPSEWGTGDDSKFGLLRERSSLFSPSGGAASELTPFSRNVSGIPLSEDLPSMSRYPSGNVFGLNRFESLDWNASLKEETFDSAPESFSLARQLSTDVSAMLA